MCEKSEEKITVTVTEPGTVTISLEEYRALVRKGAMLDLIAESIRAHIDEGNSPYTSVDASLVRQATGTAGYTAAARAETEVGEG